MPNRSGTAARLLASLIGLAIVVLAFVPTSMLALDWLRRAAAATAVPVGSVAPGSAVPASPTPAAAVSVSPEPTPGSTPGSTAEPSAGPTPVSTAEPSASPAPAAAPFAMGVSRRGVFVSEETKISCASAAIQIVDQDQHGAGFERLGDIAEFAGELMAEAHLSAGIAQAYLTRQGSQQFGGVHAEGAHTFPQAEHSRQQADQQMLEIALALESEMALTTMARRWRWLWLWLSRLRLRLRWRWLSRLRWRWRWR